MNVPPNEYIVELESHPNQRPLVFLAKIVEGEHAGKGMSINLGTVRCDNLICEEENED